VRIQPAFPAISFRSYRGRDDPPGNEHFIGVTSWAALCGATGEELKSGEYLGMRLIDDTGATWVVTEVRRLGYRTPLWQRALMTVLNQRDEIFHAVEFEFEERAATSFAEVQDRVCRLIDENREEWIDDEAMAGEAGPPVILEDVIEAAKAAVKRATNLTELFDGLEAVGSY
jgi:hypothetical protein